MADLVSAAPAPSAPIFDNARVLLYNVPPWNQLGFGVPNFGGRVATLTQPIWRLVNEIGHAQLLIMTHQDARRAQPPSANIICMIGKLINRVQSVLAGRAKQESDNILQAGHAQQQVYIFRLHPCPYFSGPMVVNPFLAEFNDLCMVGLTNAIRHSDNNQPLNITASFAKLVWSYFAEIKRLVATELLGWSAADASDDTKMLPTQTPLPSYAPSANIINMEPLLDPGIVTSVPTADDLRPFFVGIPANLIIPNLAQYPVGPNLNLDSLAGSAVPGAASLIGLNAVTPAGGSMMGPTAAAQAVLDATARNAAAQPAQPSASPPGSSPANGQIGVPPA